MKKLTPKNKSSKSKKKNTKATPVAKHFLWFEKLPNWLKKILRSKVFRIVIGILLAWYILFWFAGYLNPIFFQPVKGPNYGVSFSAKRARELDVDPKANFEALLDDMGFRRFRLMSYWDEIEKKRGQFDFAELDWQMDEVAKYQGKVSLGLGLRQPRWPECHAPEWSNQLKGNDWKQALYAFMEIVVKRYENHPALDSWQLENEAVNNWFGTCDKPDVQRLNEEFKLVKSWSRKPVWMSLSDQHGYPINPPKPDKFGFSVYRWVWNDKIPPTQSYLIYPTPIWYHRLRAAIIKAYTGREIFIHELQVEPWGPVDTKYLSVEEQNKSMSLRQIHDNIMFARQIGEKEIYLWGSEWWYWRKVNGDDSVWKQVKHELDTQH